MTDSAGIAHDTGGGGRQSLHARIIGLMPTFTPAERALADEVLARPSRVVSSTITTLAEACGTSRTTVTRFCRALGLSGYAELRLTLAAETGGDSRVWNEGIGTDIAPDDSIEIVMSKIAQIDSQAIEETAAQIDLDALARATDALVVARRIDIYAVSGSATVAGDFHLRLHRIERNAFLWSDVHSALTSATLLDERDVAIGLSHSGETSEVCEPLRIAGQNGATTVGLTNYPRSTLAEIADITLLTTARALTGRASSSGGRHAQMLLLDALYVGIAQRDHVRVQRALDATAATVAGHRSIRESRRTDTS